MRVLIVSDTHGREENLQRVLSRTEAFDCVIHLGDSGCTESYFQKMVQCPVYMVAGNCDYFTDLPRVRIAELGGVRMLLTHGHYHYVNVRTKELEADARKNNCAIAMFGHTHKPYLDIASPDLIVVNPGSLSLPRQEGHRPTYAVMQTVPGERPEITIHSL